MISVFQPKISFLNIFTVLKYLLKSDISGTSSVVKEFENNFSKKFNTKYAIAVSNGSVALDLALNLLNLTEEDEVILPAFTIISPLSAVVRSGAKPVFCDVDKNTWNMTLENIKKKTTKKTKAIVLIHTYGLPAEATLIAKFCKDNKIKIIEDAAESHGQKENGKLCGTFGDISTFSFYANKHITTGEGGMILTNNKTYYENAMKMRNLDFPIMDTGRNRFNHDKFYWNYRMSGMQAALGISQINSLEKTINLKIRQGEIYQKLFNPYLDKIQLPKREVRGSKNHYWVFGIVIKEPNKRDDLMKYLQTKNIQTRAFFWPLHKQNALSSSKQNTTLPVSENLGSNGLYIPIGKHIKKRTQIKIVNEIINYLNQI